MKSRSMSTSYCLKKYLPENKQVKLKVSGREDSLLKCWGHLHQFGLGKKNSLDLFTALKDWDIFFKTSFSYVQMKLLLISIKSGGTISLILPK